MQTAIPDTLRYITPANLYHHPNNRGYDTADLEEMAASMRVNGVLQNLVVVPYDPTIHQIPVTDPTEAYVVVIGNRRMDAAVMAGLQEVPCIVRDLTLKQQISTMLVENIQRQNMTPIEEAEAMQMMLDLGDTMEKIEKETGFSRTTVRNRLSLLKLNREKLDAAQTRGATLSDYVKLQQIKDEGARNKVLDAVGTPNFDYQLKQALTTQQRQEKYKQIEQEVAKFATYHQDPQADEVPVRYYYSNTKEDVEAPADADTTAYFYRTLEPHHVYTYRLKKPGETTLKDERAAEQAEFEKACLLIEDATTTAFELRTDFVKHLAPSTAKRAFPKFVGLTMFTMEALGQSYYGHSPVDHALLAEILDIPYIQATNRVDETALRDKAEKFPELTYFAMVYTAMEDNTLKYWKRQIKYNPSQHFVVPSQEPKLDAIYDALCALGYELSDEEKALRNGTSTLFTGANDE